MAEQNATNSASSSIGEVQAVTGRVIAIGANGVERQLFAGDQIYPDDLIRTIGQGTIKVALKDGTSFDLGQGAEALLDEAVHSSNVEALRAAAVAEAAEIQRAIAEGGDPTEIADPTAAGGGGGGTGESIENAVGIERTGRVGVVEAGFETGGLERGIEPVPVDPVYFGIGSDGAPAGGTEPAAPAPLPTLALTVSAPDDSNDNTPTITGTTDAGAGSTVSLTVTDSAGNVQNLTTTVQGDGSYSVEVPVALADGGYTVDASVTDTAGNTANASDPGSVVTSGGTNDASVAVDDIGTTDEGTLLSVNAANGVLTNDTDLDGDTLTVSEVNGTAADVGSPITLASGARLTLNDNGSYDYDPNGAFESLGVGDSTTDSFSYTVTDNHGESETATVTITVTGTNDGLTAVDDIGTTDEGTLLSVNAANGVLTNDTDLDGDTLTVSEVNGTAADVGSPITLASGARLTLNDNGSYDYDPNGAFESLGVGDSTTDSFSYTVTDNHGESETATVTITVTGTNDGLTAVDDIGTTDEGTLLSVNAANGVLTNDTDLDGDTLTVSEVNGTAADVGSPITLASGARLTLNDNGSYDYDPNGAFESLGVGDSTTDSFSYTVTDNHGESETATVTITVTGTNDGLTAVDDIGTTDEGTLLSVNAANGVLTNDTDLDGDTLTVSEVNGTAADVGSPITLASGARLTLNDNGSYDYDPNGAFESLGVGDSTTDSFSYTVTDNHGESETATVTITVTGTNDGLTAVDDIGTTDEGTLLSVNAANGVLTNDTDLDGDTLTVSEVNGTAADVGSPITLASGARLTLNDNGSYDYDPNGAFESLGVGDSTTDSFSYTVTDNHGESETATVTITVTGTNDGLTAVDDIGTTDEGTLLSVNAANGVLTNDTDLDGDTLTVSEVNGTAADVGSPITLASGARLTLNDNGSYDYDPNGAFESLGVGDSTTDSFSYTVTDNHGESETATVTITVTGTNDGLTAVDDIGTTDEGTLLSVNAANGVLTNDTDLDGDTLTVSEVNGTAADVGSPITLASGARLTLNDNGSYDYDPNGAFESLGVGDSTTDSFSYTVTDNHGESETATVTITVTGTNDGLTAVDDIGTTDEGTLLSVNAANGVLTNDTDLDGDTLTVSEVNGTAADVGSPITLASGARLTLNDNGSYDYDPNGAFESLGVGDSTTDSFSYTVTDNHGESETATVTITVTGTNDGLTAVDDIGTTDEGTLLSVNAANGVLTNDTDLDGDTLTVSEVNGTAADVGSPITLASGARLTLNDNGSYDYDPNGAFESLGVGDSTTDSFSYTVTDNHGESETATVTITVTGTNDGLTAVDDIGTTDEGTLLSVNAANGVLTNDTDLDGDTLTVSEVNGTAADVGSPITLASGARLTLNDNGSYDYDPNGAFESLGVGDSTTDSFSYTVTDNHGESETATVTITVTGTNDGLTAVDDIGTTDEGTLLSVNAANGVLTNDTDLDGDTLTVSEVNGTAADVGSPITLASGARLTLNDNGSYDYDPNGAFESLGVGDSTTDSFSYTVTDNHGESETATVTITVTGTNDGLTAVDDIGTTDEGTLLSVNAANGVLTNDTDLDGDTLTVSEVNGTAADVGSPITLASGARLTLNDNGSYDYDRTGLSRAWAWATAPRTASATRSRTTTARARRRR